MYPLQQSKDRQARLETIEKHASHNTSNANEQTGKKDNEHARNNTTKTKTITDNKDEHNNKKGNIDDINDNHKVLRRSEAPLPANKEGSGTALPAGGAVGAGGTSLCVKGVVGGGKALQSTGGATAPRVPQQMVPHQLQLPATSKEVAVPSSGGIPQKGIDEEMAIEVLISPSPTLPSNRAARQRSSGGETKHNPRESKAY